MGLYFIFQFKNLIKFYFFFLIIISLNERCHQQQSFIALHPLLLLRCILLILWFLRALLAHIHRIWSYLFACVYPRLVSNLEFFNLILSLLNRYVFWRVKHIIRNQLFHILGSVEYRLVLSSHYSKLYNPTKILFG